jgi:uncharacterized membrane protein YbhN (UPF0104 family)
MNRYIHKIKKIVLWVVFISSLAYIVYELRSFSNIWKEIKKFPAQNLGTAFFFVSLLMLVNWLSEAKKWQYLVQKIIPDYTFRLSLQTILCGITLGLFTPNRVGEYGARLFYVENEHKADLLILAFIDRFAQLWVTVLFGVVFLFTYTTSFLQEYTNIVLILSIVLLVFHISLVIFRNKIISFIISRRLFRKYFSVPLYLSSKDMSIVLGYASLRYSIFVVQYLIWGYYTDNFYDIEKGIVSINTMLFIKSVVPSAGLSELGIRESVLIYLYKNYGMSAVTAFHSALVIYMVNLLIPAVIGLFFMPRMAFWKEKR